MQEQKENLQSQMAITKEFSVDQLNKALFDFEDVMERAMCPFLVLGGSAIDLHDKYNLRGDKVEVGIKALCLTDMVISTLKTYRDLDIKKEDKGFSYEVDGVPVEVKIIHKKYKFFENPQMVFYWGGDYQLPNSMVDYLKARHIIQ